MAGWPWESGWDGKGMHNPIAPLDVLFQMYTDTGQRVAVAEGEKTGDDKTPKCTCTIC